MHTECVRMSVTEAHERLADWIRNMDTDELARAVSEHAPPRHCDPTPVQVFDDCGGDDDSAPYLAGKRMRAVFVMIDDELKTAGLV